VARVSRRLQPLEAGVRYALDCAEDVTPRLLRRPTPCRDWDLQMLLEHVGDSIAVLRDGLAVGSVDMNTAFQARRPLGVAQLRDNATGLLATCAATDPGKGHIVLEDLELSTRVLAAAGAIEVAVHGWDISVACGSRKPLPSGLAAVLFSIAPLLMPPHSRRGLFDDPVPLPAVASPGDRLVAFLGRNPR
jgi:uncharacterized protein (TIGR03086 family)